MTATLSFDAPEYLGLLAIVACAVVGYAGFERRRRRSAEALRRPGMDAWVVPRRPGARRPIVAAAVSAVLVGLALSAAQPRRSVDVPVEISTVILVLDVSRSMRADDVEPTRLEAAKAAAGYFVSILPSRFNVGFVTFSESASVAVAPTKERNGLTRAIRRTRLGGGTAIGEGIFGALDSIAVAFGISPRRISDVSSSGLLRGSAIVLLSDGETNSGRLNAEAVDAAVHTRVPVSTIAFGTPTGRVGGERVPVNKPELREIATRTGGQFFEAATAEELAGVYSTIESRIGVRTEQRNLTGWFVAGALALALLTMIASLVWFSRAL